MWAYELIKYSEAESMSEKTTGARSWRSGKTKRVMGSTAEDLLELLNPA
jgi:hypothetical protein